MFSTYPAHLFGLICTGSNYLRASPLLYPSSSSPRQHVETNRERKEKDGMTLSVPETSGGAWG
jgi:hypothetical protein